MHRWWLAGVCLLMATSCRFAVVGDSVASLTRDEFSREGGATYATGGVDIVTGREAIRALAADDDEPLVIGLGLMDTSNHATGVQLEQRIRRVLRDDVADVDCVIWVDVRQTSNVHRHWASRSRGFNRVLGEVAGEFDRPVARWSRTSSGHPEWFQEDGVHPNLAGQQHYAAFVASAVEHFC